MHYLMDETFVLKKLAVVQAIMDVPKQVSSAVKRINDARNAVAHSLFPEQRRRYAEHKKLLYEQADLFSKEGVAKFEIDYETAAVYLMEKSFGITT